MQIKLLKDRYTIVYLGETQTINANDVLWNVLQVRFEEPLLNNDHLWVSFYRDDITYTDEILAANDFTIKIPTGVIKLAGVWKFQLFIKVYDAVSKTYIQRKASMEGEFTVTQGLPIDDGVDYVNKATIAEVYQSSLNNLAIAEEKIALETKNSEDILSLQGFQQEQKTLNMQVSTDITTLKSRTLALGSAVTENAENIAKKQDNLSFDGEYNAISNKVATVSTVTDKIAEIVAGADASFDTLKEIADWIKAHPESVAEINAKIAKNAEDIAKKQNKLKAGANITIAEDGTISISGDLNDYVKKTGDTMTGPLKVQDNDPGVYSSVQSDGIVVLSYGKNTMYKRDGISIDDTYGGNDAYLLSFPTLIKDETIATETAVNAVKTQVALHSQVIAQSGLMYTADDVETYTERVTADGLNVLDGSKAVLKKVVGSTVACKNLFDTSFITNKTYANGSSVTVNSDGSIHVIKKAGDRISFNAKRYLPAGTYTLSNGLSVGLNVYVQFDNYATTVGSVTFAWGGGEADVYLYSESSTDGVDITLYPQLEEDVTATEYQPYFTGLKSASFAGIESGGRNLIPYPYTEMNKTVYGITFTANYDGSITLNGTATGYAGFNLADKNSLKLKVGETYTLSGGREVILAYKDENGNTKYVASTFEWKEGYEVMFLYLQVSPGDTVNNKTIYPMLNYGTTATEYTPYISPYLYAFPSTEMPLGKTIDFESNKIINAGQILEFNGTEGWKITANSQKKARLYTTPDTIARPVSALNDVAQIVNNWGYEAVSSNSLYMGTSYGIAIDTTGNIIIFDKNFEDITDISVWKDYLAQRANEGNPLQVACYAVTTTETPFTAQQLASGNEYTAYKGGTERVLDNDGAEYGADNTLTTNYMIVSEVKQ